MNLASNFYTTRITPLHFPAPLLKHWQCKCKDENGNPEEPVFAIKMNAISFKERKGKTDKITFQFTQFCIKCQDSKEIKTGRTETGKKAGSIFLPAPKGASCCTRCSHEYKLLDVGYKVRTIEFLDDCKLYFIESECPSCKYKNKETREINI